MKRKIIITQNGQTIQRQMNYIPFRYIFAVFLILLEIVAVIAVMVLLSIYVPYFWLLEVFTQAGCIISIIGKKDNPEYKLPWLLFIMAIPIVGFMFYFLFYSKKLSKKQIKKVQKLQKLRINKDNSAEIDKLEDIYAINQVYLISKLANTNLYQNTDIEYFSSGEKYFLSLLTDIKTAKKFIFIEYFIIEQGLFWTSILEVLKQKSSTGVKVVVLYDDIGCMATLPGNYFKTLAEFNIDSVPFAKLKGQATNEFNNRNHRKITVIDGKIGYTGGINLADEYINHVHRFGHWKDVGIKLFGQAVNELTRLFLIDYEMSVTQSKLLLEDYTVDFSVKNNGFCMPFGDGPKPLFEKQVAKTTILNMLNQAKQFVYITTPYLITDNELLQAIENAALRGIDVRIITPHIPDKKIILMITRSYYERLISTGVKIYEYKCGFIHAKTYVSDNEYAIVGTINLDYRSLVHHFENGVWIYRHDVIKDIIDDFIDTQNKSIEINQNQYTGNWLKKFFIATLKVFTPLL